MLCCTGSTWICTLSKFCCGCAPAWTRDTTNSEVMIETLRVMCDFTVLAPEAARQWDPCTPALLRRRSSSVRSDREGVPAWASSYGIRDTKSPRRRVLLRRAGRTNRQLRVERDWFRANDSGRNRALWGLRLPFRRCRGRLLARDPRPRFAFVPEVR